ncbi:MAG: hypothetical protein R3C62_06305 [Chloroflexota bacterium]
MTSTVTSAMGVPDWLVMRPESWKGLAKVMAWLNNAMSRVANRMDKLLFWFMMISSIAASETGK